MRLPLHKPVFLVMELQKLRVKTKHSISSICGPNSLLVVQKFESWKSNQTINCHWGF